MNCPNQKCKGSKLQTKRTLANGSEVTREKFCPKCEGRFFTTEKFKNDWEALIGKYHGQLRDLSDRTLTAEEKYKELTRLISAVLSHVKAVR